MVLARPRALCPTPARDPRQVLPAIVSWTHEGALLFLHCTCSCCSLLCLFLPTVFNCHANPPFHLLSLSLSFFVIGHCLAYSGRYLTIPLVADPLCVDFTIPHTAGPRRLTLLLSHCSTLNNSIRNCLRTPIAKCSLEALTGTLQMV